MKTLKRTFALAVAVMTLVGAIGFAVASEDIPPDAGYAPDSTQVSPRPETPQPETPATTPNESDLPVFSMDDYQEMHDNIASSTRKTENSPAFGTRYGSGVIIADRMDDILDEESIVITEANAALDSVVPLADGDTPAKTEAETTAEQAAEGAETTPDTTTANPDTGAADLLLPVMGGLCALGTAPLVLKKKK